MSHVTCRGFGLVEIVIASAIATAVIVGFGQVAQTSLKLLETEKSRLEATYLAEEGLEGVRALRDQGWAQNIAPLQNGVSYYLAATSTWGIYTAVQPPLSNRYERVITLAAVTRDANDRIAPAGTTDAGTRKVTVSVSWWNRTATSTVSVAAYLTNFLQN